MEKIKLWYEAFVAKPLILPDYLLSSQIPSIDGFRAISIIFVLIAHVKLSNNVSEEMFYSLSNLFQTGDLGVRIFFVISGFLITTLLIKEKIKNGTVNLGKFYIRRFLRIFPVFYLYLLSIVGLNLIFDFNIEWSVFIGAFLYLSNFSFFSKEWLTTHSWSLSVEEQYYLAWPWLFKKNINKAFLIACICILIAILLRALCYKFPQLTNITLAPFFINADAIFVGSILSILCCKDFIPISSLVKYRVPLIILSCLGAWGLHYLLFKGRFGVVVLPLGPTVAAFFIGILILINVISKVGILYTFLNNKIVTWLGKMSYSIYIWQQLVLVPKDYLPEKIRWSYFPLNIFIAIALGALSYYCFEIFFLRLKNKFKIVK